MHLVAQAATANNYSTVARLCNLARATAIAAIQPDIWQVLWDTANPFGVIISDLAVTGVRTEMAVCIGAYIYDWALEMLKAAETPCAAQHLTRSLRLGQNPFVRANEIGTHNAQDGLNMMILYMGWSSQQGHDSGIRAILGNAFAERHGGNKLITMSGEACDRSLRAVARRSGMSIINPYGLNVSELIGEKDHSPSLMGISKEEALQRENLWLTRMFTYFPPKLFFTEPQRQILLLAKEGYTDSEIAAQLSVNADAVKKRWVAIYERVNDTFPEMLPSSAGAGRGSEKRRTLLARLRDRPEGLRPYDRKAAG